jgi:chromosome segregation protein
MPGVVGLATDIVRHEDKFANIFSFVFGQTIIVEDLVVAQKIGVGRARMVTLAGDVVEKTGAMKGGFKQVKKGSLGFSSRFILESGQAGAVTGARTSGETKNKRFGCSV